MIAHYSSRQDNNIIVLLIYVDDIIIIGDHKEKINQLKKKVIPRI